VAIRRSVVGVIRPAVNSRSSIFAGQVSWRAFVPAAVRRRLRPLRRVYADWRRRRPPDLGDLRRVTPIDSNWGFERGMPIDRVYVERFVGRHSADIRGRVLEIAAPDYTRRFGTGVEKVDILMAMEGNPQATIVADLTDAPQIPDDSFDCAIVTQTLQFVYDVRAALATVHRVLAPGGVLLATVPGLTKISPPEDEEWGEWWHYTSRSAKRLAEEAFGVGNAEVSAYGNVLSATGFLYGLAASDLRPEELDAHDRLYEVIVGIRAVKQGRARGPA
jgi:SAM-dependent methyltransferase